MSLEKKFLKTKPICKVKFSLTGEPYITASSISLAGDFNAWSKDELPLKQSKDGTWSVSVDLENNREYQFRYVVDGSHWVNEPEADRFAFNGIDSENSVIVL